MHLSEVPAICQFLELASLMPQPLANAGMSEIMPNIRIGADPIRTLGVAKCGVGKLVKINEYGEGAVARVSCSFHGLLPISVYFSNSEIFLRADSLSHSL